MKSKIYCTVAVFSLLCIDYISAGTLFKSKKTEGTEAGNGGSPAKPADQMDGAIPAYPAGGAETKTPGGATSDDEAGDDEAGDGEDSKDKAGETPKPTSATSAEKKKNSDPVVLRIGRSEFKLSQIKASASGLPPQIRTAIPQDQMFEVLRAQFMSVCLLKIHAKKLGLEKSRDYLDQVEKMKSDLLASMAMQKEITGKLGPILSNESTLKTEYSKYLAGFKKGKEYKISLVTLDSKEKADEAVAKLRTSGFETVAKMYNSSGADFAEYIPLHLLPPVLKEKLLLVKVGDYTKEAIKLGKHYVLIKVHDTRDAVPLTFEESKPALVRSMSQREQRALLQRLKKLYKVEEFNQDGTAVTQKSGINALGGTGEEGDSETDSTDSSTPTSPSDSGKMTADVPASAPATAAPPAVPAAGSLDTSTAAAVPPAPRAPMVMPPAQPNTGFTGS
ncbi:MAG: peptidyl-prolyl cis-trans isomerase [Holosporaceae bacterium]|jgi:peptidyl-prolyl cis-trans isomerase C|nr:peptidyl-prolyl cis-trans isomerase [Holosporaceae bacterium]